LTENRLSPAPTVDVELPVDATTLAQLHDRVEAESLAPDEDDGLARYLLYLGAAYLEAEQAAAETESAEGAYRAVYRLYGKAGAASSVLRFHYGEAARASNGERRATTGRDIFVAAYGRTLDRLEQELDTRERRVRNLERALA